MIILNIIIVDSQILETMGKLVYRGKQGTVRLAFNLGSAGHQPSSKVDGEEAIDEC